MKPKRQKLPIPGVSPGPLDPEVILDYETHLRWLIETYLWEQELLRRRDFSNGGQGGSNSSSTSNWKPIGTGTLKKVGGTFVDRQREERQSYMTGASKTLQPNQLPLAERRKGGVMTDYSKVIVGRRHLRSWDKFGNVTESQQVLNATNNTLDLVFSQKGDHKRPNPHRYRKQYYNYGSGSIVNLSSDGSGSSVTGTQAWSTAYTGAFHDMGSFVYNKNLSKMYESIRGDVDLSVDAAQARQAGVMINHRFAQARSLFVKAAPEALWAIGGIVKTLKRSKPVDYGNLWLEWTYGWKPLAGSIYGSMENMILASSKDSSGVRGHPVNCKSSELGDDRTTTTYSGAGNAVVRNRVYRSIYKNRIVAFYALTTGGLNNVANYTSLNPVSIAWELVPYSFVVDWFINVGGYLRNMESALLYGSDFAYGYQSALAIEHYLEYGGGLEITGPGSTSFSQGQGNVETSRFNRSIFSSSPMPRPPSFNPKLGVSRLISAAALLGQQLHRLKAK